MIKKVLLLSLLSFQVLHSEAQLLPGFKLSGSFDEQQMIIENPANQTRILINAPAKGFEKSDKVLLIFYALPNGSSIEQTFGKKMKEGDDFRFGIQHIGAQTRFLRNTIRNRTIVVAYLENSYKSWPSWNAKTPGSKEQVTSLVDEVKLLFSEWDPEIVLNGHSGGGRFIFSYIEAAEKIPDDVIRISFLDSSYGYEDTLHGPKIVRWLNSGKNRYLSALAYNDSVVIYNEKPLVSPTGGTWYRTKMMKDYLSGSFHFKEQNRDSIMFYSTPNRKIEFLLKTNPDKKIYHTLQVELNGFIHSMLSGTKYEQKGYEYFGEKAYSEFIADTVVVPAP